MQEDFVMPFNLVVCVLYQLQSWALCKAHSSVNLWSAGTFLMLRKIFPMHIQALRN